MSLEWSKPVAGYPNYDAAARAIGVSPSLISYYMRRHGNIDTAGTRGGTPVVWNGRIFPSISAAARAAGVTPQTAWHHLERHGHLDGLGTRGRHKAGVGKPVRIGGHQWESRAAAAADLGVPYHTFRRALAGQSPRAMESILAELMRRDMQPAPRGRTAA